LKTHVRLSVYDLSARALPGRACSHGHSAIDLRYRQTVIQAARPREALIKR
jgi:hypothetical protein